MKKYAIVLLVLLLTACSLFRQVRNKSFQRFSDSMAFRLRKDPAVRWDSVVLDQSFRLYVRQVCRKRPPAGYYTSHDPGLPAPLSRCNCEEATEPDPEKLEIQYVFYSAQKKQFVYVTTIPPYVDRLASGWRNTYDEPLFTIENFANINYFNTFFFGRIGNGYLDMTAVSGEYPYRIDHSLSTDGRVLSFDKLYFHQNKMPSGAPANDLGTAVKFYRKDDWQIGLDDRPDIRYLSAQYNNFLENRTIYLLSASNDPRHQPKDVLFYFKEDYSGEPGQSWHWLHFENFRIKSY